MRNNSEQKGLRLYHGTNSDYLDSIYKDGLSPGEGWGGSSTFGVFLAADRKTALYWAKVACIREYNELDETERELDYSEYEKLPIDMKKAVVIEVVIPESKVSKLEPDLEQAEDFGLEDPTLAESLKVMRSAIYPERIPISWLGERQKVSAKANGKTFIPPKMVALEAEYGLYLRSQQPPSNRCCTPVGLARAKQLKNREPLSIDTLKRMRSYFQRHEVDKMGRDWGVSSKGFQAWLLWGGDSGRDFANRILDELGE